MARPTKRTPEREERLLAAIRAGCTQRAAAQAAGIDEDTLVNWRRRCSDFSASLARAEGEAEVRMTAIIAQAAPTDWRAAAWWLERRRNDEYGRRDRVALQVRADAEALAGELGLDADELIAEAERLTRRVRG